MTHRNGELGGEVGVAVAGEDGGFGSRKRGAGVSGPEGGREGGVAVRSGAEDGVDVLHQVIDVIEEAPAVNLVDEVRSGSDHCVLLRNKEKKNESENQRF